MHKERRRRDRERFRVTEAVRAARGEPTQFEWEQIALPDLAQVQAARGDPTAVAHDPDTALFGGWRIKDLSAALKGPGETGRTERRRR